MDALKLFIPITKLDEEKREVYGTLTQEVRDRDGEIMDYATSKPLFEKWSRNVQDATDGKSMGNVREMHQPSAVGKIIAMTFDDGAAAIEIGVKVVDDAAWEKCREGVYSGFSAGGRYVKKWRGDGDPAGTTRFTADPYEASLVDYPAVPTATFAVVKVGGGIEVRKFKKIAEREDANPKAGKEKYGDVKFADTKNKKYPLDTKAHVRAALSYWGMPKNREKYSADDQKVIGARIRAAAKEFGIEASEKAMLNGDFSKGLWEVARLANLTQELCWLRDSAVIERDVEGDNSAVPDQLTEHLEGLFDALEDMTSEEIEELRAQAAARAEAAKNANKSATSSTTNHSKGASAMSDNTFRKIAKKHMEKLDGIVDHAHALHKLFGEHAEKCEGTKMGEMAKAMHTMMGDHCDKLDGFKDEVGGLPTTDTDGSDDKGVSGAEKMAKMTGERDEALKKIASLEAKVAENDTALKAAKAEVTTLTGQLDEALDGVEQLMTKAKGSLLPADRGGDGDAEMRKAAEAKKAAEAADANLSPRERFKKAMKSTLARPTVSNGLGAEYTINEETGDAVPAGK